MTDSDPADPLQVQQHEDGAWSAPHPDEDPEKRDVVFSGQFLGQMIMVASAANRGEKEVKSIHAVFARSGAYSAGPIRYEDETMHSGQAWASNSLTAFQGERLLSRSLVLLNTVEPDLMRHSPAMPDVPAPERCKAWDDIPYAYPGSEVRHVSPERDCTVDGSPMSQYWIRLPEAIGPGAASQAAVAWCQPGFTIATAMQPHRDRIRIGDAHRTISTGVISHTTHFHDEPTRGGWLLIANIAVYAGNGRVFGNGMVFGQDGRLISTFGQDAMARKPVAPLDVKRSM